MPYSSIADLPQDVKALPEGAQKIFLATFNSAYSGTCKTKTQDREGCAFAIAWSAVKRQYTQEDGKWVKKAAAGVESASSSPVEFDVAGAAKDKPLTISGPLIEIGALNKNGWGISDEEAGNVIASLVGAPLKICGGQAALKNEHSCDYNWDPNAAIGTVTAAYKENGWVHTKADITDSIAKQKISEGTWPNKWSVFLSYKQSEENGMLKGTKGRAVTLVRNPAYLNAGFNAGGIMEGMSDENLLYESAWSDAQRRWYFANLKEGNIDKYGNPTDKGKKAGIHETSEFKEGKRVKKERIYKKYKKLGYGEEYSRQVSEYTVENEGRPEPDMSTREGRKEAQKRLEEYNKRYPNQPTYRQHQSKQGMGKGIEKQLVRKYGGGSELDPDGDFQHLPGAEFAAGAKGGGASTGTEDYTHDDVVKMLDFMKANPNMADKEMMDKLYGILDAVDKKNFMKSMLGDLKNHPEMMDDDMRSMMQGMMKASAAYLKNINGGSNLTEKGEGTGGAPQEKIFTQADLDKAVAAAIETERAANQEATKQMRADFEKLAAASIERAKTETLDQLTRERLAQEVAQLQVGAGMIKPEEAEGTTKTLMTKSAAALTEDKNLLMKVKGALEAAGATAVNKFKESQLPAKDNTPAAAGLSEAIKKINSKFKGVV